VCVCVCVCVCARACVRACVANLTYKDVARLQVPVQHRRLARVEVQHTPGDASNHGHQLGRVPSGRRAVMQHDIQSPPGAVLHDQVQIIPVLTQTPQAHYVVMRPCKMQASCLGLFAWEMHYGFWMCSCTRLQKPLLSNATFLEVSSPMECQQTTSTKESDNSANAVLHRCSMHMVGQAPHYCMT